MNLEIENLISDNKLSLPEIIDFIHIYKKMVDSGILTIKGFEFILDLLGIEWDGVNTFKISEDTEYILA